MTVEQLRAAMHALRYTSDQADYVESWFAVSVPGTWHFSPPGRGGSVTVLMVGDGPDPFLWSIRCSPYGTESSIHEMTLRPDDEEWGWQTGATV